jgi:hypothetical protein
MGVDGVADGGGSGCGVGGGQGGRRGEAVSEGRIEQVGLGVRVGGLVAGRCVQRSGCVEAGVVAGGRVAAELAG